MKKISTALVLVFFSVLVSFQAPAQTTLYSQDFDSTLALPSGWYASSHSWIIDSAAANASCCYAGATGFNNVVIQNVSATLGFDSLITNSISTLGFDSITVEWGARLTKHYEDSGSTVALYWSTNGTTWTQQAYTENPNNSGWYPENDSTPIILPAAAANQATLWLMWVADIHANPSGTYRIDDLTIAGDSIQAIDTATGIKDISQNTFAHIYVSNNTNINISTRQAMTDNLDIEIYDLTGRLVIETNMSAATLTIDGSSFAPGMYMVRVSDATRSTVSKVVLK
jgi:hypothetical protein